MKYFIREVNGKTKQKQKVLLRLQKEILPSDEPCDTTQGHWWIVYTEHGHAVGFGGMVQSLQFTDCVFFLRAGVCYEHTGKALQKRLLKARIRKAKSMGFNWAVSTTYDNPASANSLINCGFKMYDPSKPWGANGTCYWRIKIV
jgi:hypothetical protein